MQTSIRPLVPNGADISWNLLKVRAPEIWALGATGERSTGPSSWQAAGIAILDDGGDYQNLAYAIANWQFSSATSPLPNNFTTDQSPVWQGPHGTAVAGYAASDADGLWTAGVAPRAAVRFIRVIPVMGNGDWGWIIAGLERVAIEGQSVVNMSFGNCGALPPSTVHAAIQALTVRTPSDAASPGAGISLVAAGGNGLHSSQGCSTTAVHYPAAYPEVIAVAATDANDGQTLYPNLSRGPAIDLAAPGICVPRLEVGGGVNTSCGDYTTGTSFAAPHVSGIIAAIRALNPTWSATFVLQRLKATTIKIAGQPVPSDRYGYGIVNPYPVVATPLLGVSISGPSAVKPNVTCGWEAIAVGGGGPLVYSWTINSVPAGGNSSLLGTTLSASSTLAVTVTDVTMQVASASKIVNVSAKAGTCLY